MKKYTLLFGIILLCSSTAMAADLDLRNLDSDTRSMAPNSNSIMFKQNAEQYRQLTPLFPYTTLFRSN